MLIGPKQDWLLSEKCVAAVRAGAARWRVRLEVGLRPTICRSCGASFKGQRLSFKHFSLESRTYDFCGSIHVTEADCIPGQLTQWQMQQIEELEAEEDLQEN